MPDPNDALMRYLRSSYGDPPTSQPAAEARTDNQLRSLTPLISEYIATRRISAIVDLGAGKGVLLGRLLALESFVKSDVEYVAVEEPASHDAIIQLAVPRGLHKRVTLTSLDDYYAGRGGRPGGSTLFVCRNVLHELDIEAATAFFERLRRTLVPGDRVLIQDLATFPQHERHNACWRADDVRRILEDLGCKLHVVDDSSASGNSWYTIAAEREACARELYPIDVGAVRQRQWQDWLRLGALSDVDPTLRPVELAKIDFDLQFSALTAQLAKVGYQLVLTAAQQHVALRDEFQHALMHVPARLRRRVEAAGIAHFKNRSNSITALQGFMTSDACVVAICGPTRMGKTTLVQHVLATFHHERSVVAIDCLRTSSVWNLLESLLEQLGVRVTPTILPRLRSIAYDSVADIVRPYFASVGPMLVVSLDHVERLLQPDGKFADHEIVRLLHDLAHAPRVKLILTSRVQPPLDFAPPGGSFVGDTPPVGRFPRGPHVENVISTIAGITEYPQEILDIIDQHPHLAHLAALGLRTMGRDAAADPVHLARLRNELRSESLDALVDPESRAAFEWLALVRVPVPRSFLERIVGRAVLRAAESTGLLIAFDEPSGQTVVRSIGALRPVVRSHHRWVADEDASAGSDAEEVARHTHLKSEFAEEYRTTGDPRWLRESIYHGSRTSGTESLASLGRMYRSEICGAGDEWFRNHRYADAREALKLGIQFGDASAHTRMRAASCAVRLGKADVGQREYDALFREYPRDTSIRSSYVDALLYARRFETALDFLRREFPTPESAWTFNQYGRAYSGVFEYIRACDAFENALRRESTPYTFVWLARARHRLGDRTAAEQTIQRGLREFPNDPRLMREYGQWLEKNSDPDRALGLLRELVERDRRDGFVVNALVRVLCRIDRVAEARALWQKVEHFVAPDFMAPAVEAHLLMREGQYEHALRVLENVPENTDEEHRLGQRSEVYLAWANEVGGDAGRAIARRGLLALDKVPKNVPLLASQARLARLAGDQGAVTRAVAAIAKLNPRAPDLEQLRQAPSA